MFNTDYLSVGITAGGVDVPLDSVVLQKASIISSVQQNVPVAQIVLADNAGFFQKVVSLVDGLQVSISIGPTINTVKTIPFRLFLPKSNVGQVSSSIVLTMYYDAPLYFGGTTNVSIQSTSTDAIKQIAQQVSLTANVDAAGDLQTWIPANQRWCQFASGIAKAGWSSSTSAFLLGLNLDGVLLYKNVGAYTYASNVPTLRLGQVESDGSYIPVSSWEQRAVSGFNNMRGAYHGAQQSQSYLASTGISSTNTTVQKTKGTQFLYMNKQVKSQLDSAKLFKWSVIDCGNTHPNYQTAIYQNARLLKTNSQRLSVLTMQQTNLDLLDKLQVQAFVPSDSGETSKALSGPSGFYFIVGKTVFADIRGVYCEKLELARDGTNEDLQQQQV